MLFIICIYKISTGQSPLKKKEIQYVFAFQLMHVNFYFYNATKLYIFIYNTTAKMIVFI